MSALLLDTHVWIWLGEGIEEKLAPSIIGMLDQAASEGKVSISIISVWELGLLAAKGRLLLSLPVREWVDLFFKRSGCQLSSLEPDIALESNFLPAKLPADPVDRMLVATARVRDLTLLTRDREILAYSKAGHVRALEV